MYFSTVKHSRKNASRLRGREVTFAVVQLQLQFREAASPHAHSFTTTKVSLRQAEPYFTVVKLHLPLADTASLA